MNTFTLVISTALLVPLLVAKSMQFHEWGLLAPVGVASVLAYILTDRLIPSIKVLTANAGLAGRDLSKVSTDKM